MWQTKIINYANNIHKKVYHEAKQVNRNDAKREPIIQENNSEKQIHINSDSLN